VTVMINNVKAMNTFSKGVLAGVMQALEMCSDDPSGEWLPRGQRLELPW
jgi:enoyl-CoA hydratase/carnithine racemase